VNRLEAVILANDLEPGAGRTDVDAWDRLHELSLPVTVACGDLDVPVLVERSRKLADRVSNATYRVLAGMAHLPQLEQSAIVATLIMKAMDGRPRHDRASQPTASATMWLSVWSGGASPRGDHRR
jgi:pimeloyl-ACP methyl ester carboxylesterase